MKTAKSNIYSDGVCVYVLISVINPLTGKVALVLADLFAIAVFIFSAITWIPGLMLCTLLLMTLLTKYTLWNFYGKENLIINTKSLSYQHDYGFFKTSYTTKSINSKLIIISKKDEGEEGKVRCEFITYSEVDNVPFEIYTMTFPVSDDESQYMNKLIEALYIDKLTDSYEFPTINLN